ncbi:hypothetical protein [Terricaulis sp.]|uniref:hypothetical protein n=1 Tax=Terricaulis sp. TaxID=2768686 RepID=UPI003783AC76
MGFLNYLWRLARFWPDPGMGLRPGSGVAVFVTFLILLFTCIGIVLVILGFDLNRVDVWLDAHGGLFDLIGTVLFKALLAFVLLVCAILVAGALFDRSNPERPGIVSVLVALLIGYFAWVGIFLE